MNTALILLLLLAIVILGYFNLRYYNFAFKDGLSGLFNRRQFDYDTRELKFRRRTDNQILILIDVDKFKLINDKYGHSAGDKVIRKIGWELLGCLRDNDRAYRIGGDEFAVLTHSSVAITRILATITANISVGMANVMDSGSFLKAYEDADKELYKNKLSKTI